MTLEEMMVRLSEEFDCEVFVTPPVVAEPEMVICPRFFIKYDGKVRKLKCPVPGKYTEQTEVNLRNELSLYF